MWAPYLVVFTTTIMQKHLSKKHDDFFYNSPFYQYTALKHLFLKTEKIVDYELASCAQIILYFEL